MGGSSTHHHQLDSICTHKLKHRRASLCTLVCPSLCVYWHECVLWISKDVCRCQTCWRRPSTRIEWPPERRTAIYHTFNSFMKHNFSGLNWCKGICALHPWLCTHSGTRNWSICVFGGLLFEHEGFYQPSRMQALEPCFCSCAKLCSKGCAICKCLSMGIDILISSTVTKLTGCFGPVIA